MGDWKVGGRRTSGPRVVAGAILVAILFSACSGAESAQVTLPPTTAAATTTAQPTTEPPATEPASDPMAEAVEVWQDLMVAAARRAQSDVPDDAIGELATAEVDEKLGSIFIGEFAREVVSYASATPGTGGAVEVQDCLFLSQAIVESPTVWFSGTVEPGPTGGWLVTRADVETLAGCAPASFAEDVFADYETYWDSRHLFFDPPDPDAPALAETATGEMLPFLRELAVRFRDDGHVLRDRPTTHPEIHQILSPTEVVVTDCQLADPQRGVYDATTGERTAVIPPIAPDQTDALRVTLRLEADTWKVSDVQGNRPADCEFAPTRLGLPVVS